jgi:tetratricopeptide (TPR) repeat protein
MKLRLRFTVATLTSLAGALAASCQGTPPRTPAAYASAPPSVAEDGRTPGGSALVPAANNVSVAVAQSPLALTASDGTGLRLAELRAEAIIDGPLAFTEMRLTFENPLDRQLEGTFRITLPQGASLGRFAMKIGGEWQEGEVVELSEARRAYEDFLHRKQDPALMEKAAGNEFSARVFPIPARGTKEIIIAYAHEIHDAPYVLPLRGLPELGVLDVKATVVGAKSEAPRLAGRVTTPDKDYVVDVAALTGADKAASGARLSGVRSGEFAIVRVKPSMGTQPDPITTAIVLVDTSASRMLGFEDEVKLVERLVKRVAEGQGGQGTVTVAAFDQTISPIFEGKAADFGAKDLAKLRERGALGASDMEHALKWAHEQAKKSGRKRVVLVSDGVSTAGTSDSKKLAAEVASMRDAGVERLDVLAVGGIRDDAALLRLVRGQLPHDGIVADVSAGETAAVRRLGEATRSGIAVKVEGATWAWPTKLDGVQAGDGYTIYAQLAADRPVKISVDGKPAEVVDLRKTERPLLERGIAQAKIASMLEREATTKDDLKKSIISLAVSQRIMTPYTAMLVLETEQDYARFHVDRRSLTDVLAVREGAVKRVHRTSIAFPKGFQAPPPMDVDRDDEDRNGANDSMASQESKEESVESGALVPRAAGGAPAAVRPRPARSAPRPVASSSAPRMEAAPAAKPAAEAPPMASALAESTHDAAAPRAPRAMSPSMSPPPPAPPSARRGNTGGGHAEALLRGAQESSMTSLDVTTQDTGHASQPPYEGKFAEVMEKIAAKGRTDEALATARAWQKESPGDVLALVALGEAAEAKNLSELAARAYGSVIDLFPNRADLRRFAGERLERLKDASAMSLAIDSFRKAVADRPDHPSSHRLLAFALLRDKQYEKAFEAALAGSRRAYEADRFLGVDRILREDLGLIGAAWAHAQPARQAEILARVRQSGGRLENGPSLRFVLDWQTDANDVDFHIHDSRGGHAFYGSPHLESGGDLYADVTTGYGPECFTIRLPKGKRPDYKLEAHYYSRGPMGYGMGKLEIIDHDGNGNITFEERPFIVMVDSAFVNLGTVTR